MARVVITLIIAVLFGYATCSAPFNDPMCYTAGIFGLDGDTKTNEAGTSVSVTCSSTGGIDPFPQLQWTRNGVVLGGNLTNDSKKLQTKLIMHWTLSGVDHGNSLVCTVTHPELSSPMSCIVGPILVRYGPDVALYPMRVVKEVGETANFTCSATGNPAIQSMTWFFNGTTTSPDSRRFVMKRDNNVYELSVYNIAIADYTLEMKCQVTSSRTVSYKVAVIVPLNETVYTAGYSRNDMSAIVVVFMLMSLSAVKEFV